MKNKKIGGARGTTGRAKRFPSQCPPRGFRFYSPQASRTTGSPDVVFDFGDYVLSSADKAMYENTLNITLNRSCIKDLKKNVLLYVCLTLF